MRFACSLIRALKAASFPIRAAVRSTVSSASGQGPANPETAAITRVSVAQCGSIGTSIWAASRSDSINFFLTFNPGKTSLTFALPIVLCLRPSQPLRNFFGDPKGGGHDDQRRIHFTARRKEAAIHNVEIVEFVRFAVDIPGRGARVAILSIEPRQQNGACGSHQSLKSYGLSLWLDLCYSGQPEWVRKWLAGITRKP